MNQKSKNELGGANNALTRYQERASMESTSSIGAEITRLEEMVKHYKEVSFALGVLLAVSVVFIIGLWIYSVNLQDAILFLEWKEEMK